MLCEVPPLMLGWISFWVLALLCLVLKGISHLHPQRKSPQQGRPVQGTLHCRLNSKAIGFCGSRGGKTEPRSLRGLESQALGSVLRGIACEASVRLSLVIPGCLPPSEQPGRF